MYTSESRPRLLLVMDSTVSLLSQNKADLTSRIMTHLNVKPSSLPLVLDCLEEGLETLPQQEQEEDRPQPHEDGEADPPGGEKQYSGASPHVSLLSRQTFLETLTSFLLLLHSPAITIGLFLTTCREKAPKVCQSLQTPMQWSLLIVFLTNKQRPVIHINQLKYLFFKY